MKNVGLVLIQGEDFFSELDLIRKAAVHKGLELVEGAERPYSKPIKTYVLDDKLLFILEQHNFKRTRSDDIFTLFDEGSKSRDYWSFKLLEGEKHKFDLRIKLSVLFQLNFRRRGIVFMPQAHGSFFSPCSYVANLRMFKVLVDNDVEVYSIAKEVSANDGSMVVTWTDLGLGGIRSIVDLFFEFASHKEAVIDLARQDKRIFNPNPYPFRNEIESRMFIAEPAQPKVFEVWRNQHNEYLESLRL